MIEEFYERNDLIGKSVSTIEQLYIGFCKSRHVEPLGNIVNRLCNKYDLVVQGGKLQ